MTPERAERVVWLYSVEVLVAIDPHDPAEPAGASHPPTPGAERVARAMLAAAAGDPAAAVVVGAPELLDVMPEAEARAFTDSVTPVSVPPVLGGRSPR